MQEFFAMGGYAFYVWTAWGAGFAVLIGLGIASWSRARRLGAMVEGLEAHRPRSRPRASFEDTAAGDIMS